MFADVLAGVLANVLWKIIYCSKNKQNWHRDSLHLERISFCIPLR